MRTSDYTGNFTINRSAEHVFEALTQRIPEWWTADFTGSGAGIGDAFTVRFGGTHKTFLISELEPGQRVGWHCTDAWLDLPEIDKKDEWIGTDIIWDIVPLDFGVMVNIIHRGLRPGTDCYNACEKGWASFMTSLYTLLESGYGLPYTAS